MYSPQWGKKVNQQILIGKPFHMKLRILSPQNGK